MGHITNPVQRQAAGAPLKETTFVERMKIELDELSQKISKLSEFLGSPGAGRLAPLDQDLLYAQHDAMRTYRRILDIRLNRVAAPEIKPLDDGAGEILADGVRFAKPEEKEPLPFT